MAYSMHINYIVKYKGSLRRLRVGLGMCPPDRTCKIALNISEFHFTTLGKETRLWLAPTILMHIFLKSKTRTNVKLQKAEYIYIHAILFQKKIWKVNILMVKWLINNHSKPTPFNFYSRARHKKRTWVICLPVWLDTPWENRKVHGLNKWGSWNRFFIPSTHSCSYCQKTSLREKKKDNTRSSFSECYLQQMRMVLRKGSNRKHATSYHFTHRDTNANHQQEH